MQIFFWETSAFMLLYPMVWIPAMGYLEIFDERLPWFIAMIVVPMARRGAKRSTLLLICLIMSNCFIHPMV